VPDNVIEQAVRTALVTADSLDIDHLEVHSIDAHVTLRGYVPSLRQKQEAERIAGGVTGVSAVKDDLEVTKIEDHF
jgi:osmotically-inducible protein OsmY